MLKFPSYSLKCLNTLKENGYEAFFVGGCVRDALLGRSYDDVDITTNATPDKVTELFEHTVPTGIKHGTVTVIIDNNNIEVTTYRTEESYSDSRHPDKVNFVTDLEDDLSRRDFTVNALAYDPSLGITDLFRGIDDLNSGIIRAVGDPQKRFSEDSLRILRAFRFSSVLGMSIEESTKTAAFKLGHLVERVSGERVLSELIKLCAGKIQSSFIDFINTGALSCFGISDIDPELCPFKDIYPLKSDPLTKTAIFISLTKHNTPMIKSTLKPSSALLKLVEFFDTVTEKSLVLASRADIKRALNKHSKPLLIAYISRLSLCDKTASARLSKEIEDIERLSEPYSISHLRISGDDLKAVGAEGKEIGALLNKALEAVIVDPARNDKETLLKILL